MTNREFYKEQILDIVCDGDSFAFNECKNEIMTCRVRHCKLNIVNLLENIL